MAFFRRLIFSILMAGMATAASAGEVIEIKPRGGVTLKMLAIDPGDAEAVVALFAGGHGRLKVLNDGTHKWMKGNFVIRTRRLFADNGLVSVIIDAPSDRLKKPGLTFDYRMGEEHALDIKKVINKLRKTYPGLPVWLIGTSRGSTSVANVAATIKNGGPDGIVLTSAVGVSNKHGGNILDYDLESINIPVLVAHHLEDECWLTPVSGARDIKARLTGSTVAEMMEFVGGDAGNGNPCKAKSHHGFLGIEGKAVNAISAWIKSH